MADEGDEGSGRATVRIEIFSCIPRQPKVAVRFGGPQCEWQWVGVPTHAPATLSRALPASAGASMSFSLPSSADGGGGSGSARTYELAVAPAPTDDDGESTHHVVCVDARRVPETLITLRSHRLGTEFFQVVMIWSLHLAQSTGDGLVHAAEHASTLSCSMAGAGAGEAEGCGRRLFELNSYPRRFTPAPPPRDPSQRREVGVSGCSPGSGEGVAGEVIPAADGHRHLRALEGRSTGGGVPAATPLLPPQEQLSAASSLFAEAPSHRLVLLASVLSLRRRNAALSRVVEISLSLEGADDASPLQPVCILNTVGTTRDNAAKVAQMGPPCLLPSFIGLRPAVRDAAASVPLRVRCSVLEVYSKRGKSPATDSRTPSPSLSRGGWRSASALSGTGENAETGICPLGEGRVPLPLPRAWATADEAADPCLQWTPHPYLGQAAAAQTTVHCDADDVSLGFMLMTLSTYREAVLNYEAVSAERPVHVEVRLDELLCGEELAPLLQQQRQHVVAEVWLTHPVASLECVPLSGDVAPCRHAVVTLEGAASANGAQALFFPMGHPFACLSIAATLHTEADPQGILYHACVPLELLQLGAWRRLSVPLMTNSSSQATSLSLRYRLGSHKSPLPVATSECPVCLQSYTFQVIAPSCQNLVALLHQRGGVVAHSLRILVSDVKDSMARAFSRVVEGTELMLHGPLQDGLNLEVVFNRVLFVPRAARDDANDDNGNLLLRCQVLAFAAREEAEQLHNGCCVAEGHVVLLSGQGGSQREAATTCPIDVHLAMDFDSQRPTECALLRLAGTVKHSTYAQTENVLCIRSCQLLRQPHGTLASVSDSTAALCLWFRSSTCEFAGDERMRASRRFQSVLMQMAAVLQPRGQAIPCREFVLVTDAARRTLCVALVPYTPPPPSPQTHLHCSHDARRAAWKSLKRFVKTLSPPEERGASLQGSMTSMNAVNYLELDLTTSLAPCCTIAGVSRISDALQLYLDAEWVQAASSSARSSMLPVPAPHLWAVRVTRTLRPGEAYGVLLVASTPIRQDEAYASPPRQLSEERSLRWGRPPRWRSPSQSWSRSQSTMQQGDGHLASCVDATTVRAAVSLLGLASPAQTQFVFGDAYAPQMHVSLRVDGQCELSITTDALAGCGTGFADAEAAVIDWSHGSLLVDQGGPRHGRAASESESQGRWQVAEEEEEEDKRLQHPGCLFVPFLTPVEAPEGAQLRVRYHTLTRCGREGALLVGGIRGGAKPMLHFYSFGANAWTPFAADAASAPTHFHRGRRRWDFTARQGHTAVYCPLTNAVYVYGGGGLSAMEPLQTADTQDIGGCDDADAAARQDHRAAPLGYFKDVWCISLAEKVVERVKTIQPAEAVHSLLTARWRHAAAYYNNCMFVVGGKASRDCAAPRSSSPSNLQPLPSSTGEGAAGEAVEVVCSCSELLVLNLSTRAWSRHVCGGSACPEPRHGHAAATRDASMYVYGGTSAAGDLLDDLHELDLATCRWRRIWHSGATAPPAMRLAALDTAVVDNTPCLILVEGETATPSPQMNVYLFSHNSNLWRAVQFNCPPGPSRIGGAICEVTVASGRRLRCYRRARQRLPISSAPHIKLLLVGGERRGGAPLEAQGPFRSRRSASTCLMTLSWGDRAPVEQHEVVAEVQAHTAAAEQSPPHPTRRRRWQRRRSPIPSVLTRRMQNELVNRLYYLEMEKRKQRERQRSLHATYRQRPSSHTRRSPSPQPRRAQPQTLHIHNCHSADAAAMGVLLHTHADSDAYSRTYRAPMHDSTLYYKPQPPTQPRVKRETPTRQIRLMQSHPQLTTPNMETGATKKENVDRISPTRYTAAKEQYAAAPKKEDKNTNTPTKQEQRAFLQTENKPAPTKEKPAAVETQEHARHEEGVGAPVTPEVVPASRRRCWARKRRIQPRRRRSTHCTRRAWAHR
ncbi:uncharacterized protein Tco025E_02964 [Trypanosoma conorhini]|uniref:Uncharacterized protein n=1 Tax=Trypanosoma conorhini TaxID=83891 RepID=A0A3S5ITS7_9TRYP|nr:uncharacterized protein Tco025E_02964 [Trypanosoma conorhini]RNF23164.1 hypothetical protein Tco025E_02964 [Trypanosoma conorhini]